MTEIAARRFDVDPFRGWVCLSILVMHFYFHTLAGRVDARGLSAVSWSVAHFRFGYESFFVLAGFFLAHSFRKPSRGFLSTPMYVKRRLTRLLVPYWIVLWMVYFGRAIGNEYFDLGKPNPPIWEMLIQMVSVQNWFGVKSLNIVFWSIAVMIQAYLVWTFLFWSIRRLTGGNHDLTESILDAISVGLSLLAGANLIFEGPVPTPICSDTIFISMGILSYRISRHPERRWPLVTATAALIALAILLERSHVYAAVASFFILIWIGRGGHFPDTIATRCFRFLGIRSYSIYLTHSFVGARILELQEHLNPSGKVSVLLLCGAVVCSLLFAFAFYALVEEPLTRRVREIEYRR